MATRLKKLCLSLPVLALSMLTLSATGAQAQRSYSKAIKPTGASQQTQARTRVSSPRIQSSKTSSYAQHGSPRSRILPGSSHGKSTSRHGYRSGSQSGYRGGSQSGYQRGYHPQPSCYVTVPGHWDIREHKVWVPGRERQVWIEPVYKTWVDFCGRSHQRLVRAGYYETIVDPGYWDIHEEKVWVPGRVECSSGHGHGHHDRHRDDARYYPLRK